MVPYAALRHNSDPAIKDLYDQAKNREDREAAAELIDRLISDEGIEQIKAFASRHPGAVLASVHAIEGQGRNAIPLALTHFIAEHSGLEVDNTIVQSGVVSKTGVKSTWSRLVRRAQFEGVVQTGKDYILVDDAFSAGGTFSEMRQFIEENGGRVVDTIALANGAKSMNADLAVTKGRVLELERKFGVESLQDFLKEEALYDGNHRALTDAEARTLLGSPSLDEARDRMVEARQEGIERVLSQVVQGSSSNPGEVKAPLSKPNPPEYTASREAVFYRPKQSASREKNISTKETSMAKTIGQMTDKEFTAYQKEQTRKLNERLDGPDKGQNQPDQNSREIEQAKKAGYVQGVCECAALVDNQTIAKKLLTEMKVNKDLAKKYAHPDTYKALEKDIFAPKNEQTLQRSQGRSR